MNRDRSGHKVNIDNVKILDRDPNWFRRGVREAICIRAHRPRRSGQGEGGGEEIQSCTDLGRAG